MTHFTIRTIETKPRPFASAQRVGGLLHWRIANVGGSFYFTQRPYAAPRLVRPMGVIAAIAALAACQPPAPTYSAVAQHASGNEYVVEHGVTLSDCQQALEMYSDAADFPVTWCEIERTAR